MLWGVAAVARRLSDSSLAAPRSSHPLTPSLPPALLTPPLQWTPTARSACSTATRRWFPRCPPPPASITRADAARWHDADDATRLLEAAAPLVAPQSGGPLPPWGQDPSPPRINAAAHFIHPAVWARGGWAGDALRCTRMPPQYSAHCSAPSSHPPPSQQQPSPLPAAPPLGTHTCWGPPAPLSPLHMLLQSAAAADCIIMPSSVWNGHS